jgi:hypothetical protein
VNSTGSLYHALVRVLHIMLSTLAGKLEAFVKNSGHFVQLLKSVNHQSLDIFISIGIVTLFTKVLVNKVLQVIRNKLHNDDTG